MMVKSSGLASVFLAFVTIMVCVGQNSTMQDSSGLSEAIRVDPARLTTSDPRPLWHLAWQLEDRMSWRIPYEEAPILTGTLLTATAVSPGTRPYLMPTSRPVSLTISPQSLESVDRGEYRRAALNEALRAWRQTESPGVFLATIDGDYAFILPTAMVTAQGQIAAFVPLLDTPVSIGRTSATVGVAMRLILEQVATKRGFPIAEGNVPTNLFASEQVTIEAQNEPARRVMMRMFDDVSLKRVQAGLDIVRISWYLLYDANEKRYFFNARSLPPSKNLNDQRSRFYK